MKIRHLSFLLAAAGLWLTSCDRSPSGVPQAALAPATPPAAEPEARRALEREIADLEAQEALLRRQIQEDQWAREKAELQGQREELAREKEALAAQRAAVAAAPAAPPPPRAALAEPLEPRAPRAPSAVGPGELGRDYQMFYEGLAPYGQWMETAEYGYVWQPAAPPSPGWRPYTQGRWVDSDQGWTWVSSEPFGWATYHYGRWALLAGRGWIWVPGDTWAPAWVSWRHSEDLVGWCPLPPETVYAEDLEYGPSVDEDYGISPETYIFMPVSYFDEPVFTHCYPVAQNTVYFSATVGITHIVIRSGEVSCGGPRLDWVNRRLARPMTHYRLNRGDDWGDRRDYRPHFEDGALSCYAPRVRTSWNEGIRPSRIQGRWDDVKVVRRQDAFHGELGRRYREEQQERRTRATVALKEEPVRRLAARHEDWEKLRSRRDQLIVSAKEYRPAEPARGRPAGLDAAPDDPLEAARQKLKERQDEVARLRQQRQSAELPDKSLRGRPPQAQEQEVPRQQQAKQAEARQRQAEEEQRGPRENRGRPEAAEAARQQEAKQAEARQRQAEEEQRGPRENRGQPEAAEAARQQEAKQVEARQRQAEEEQRRDRKSVV